MRDLTDASPAAIAVERTRIPREGIGAKILASQGADGSWHRADAPVWVPTLYTFLLLRATGVDRADPAVESAVVVSRRASDGMRSFMGSRSSKGGGACINGGTLALGRLLRSPDGEPRAPLIGEQLDDGGWNCEAPKSVRSSFHSTICVLEGLLEYERAIGPAPEITAARRRGEEYLLERGLFRRRSTGEVANPEFLKFAFPPRYHYDVLRALDYFRDAGVQPERASGCLAGRRKQAAGRRSMAARGRLRRGTRHPVQRICG